MKARMFKPCVHEGAERPSSQEGRDASTGSAADGHHGSEAGGFPGQGCWGLSLLRQTDQLLFFAGMLPEIAAGLI